MVSPLALALAIGVTAVLGCGLVYPIDDLTRSAGESSRGDGGGTGDAGPGAPSRCGSDFVFCDGFERDLSAWVRPSTGAGTVQQDTTRAARGASAMHARVPELTTKGPADAILLRSFAWPAHFYVRFFGYVTSSVFSEGVNLITLVSDGGGGVALFLSSPSPGAPSRFAMTAFAVPNEGSQFSASLVPADRWFCVEVEIDRLGRRLTVSVDGAPLPELTRTLDIAPVRNLGVGLSFPSGHVGPATDAWFDEVAVDDQPVGCDR
jgi:hypothetical protein